MHDRSRKHFFLRHGPEPVRATWPGSKMGRVPVGVTSHCSIDPDVPPRGILGLPPVEISEGFQSLHSCTCATSASCVRVPVFPRVSTSQGRGACPRPWLPCRRRPALPFVRSYQLASMCGLALGRRIPDFCGIVDAAGYDSLPIRAHRQAQDVAAVPAQREQFGAGLGIPQLDCLVGAP